MDRKTFLSSLMRISLLGVLALLTGFLALKRNVRGENSCNDGPGCNTCALYPDCNKPEAIKQRKYGG